MWRELKFWVIRGWFELIFLCEWIRFCANLSCGQASCNLNRAAIWVLHEFELFMDGRNLTWARMWVVRKFDLCTYLSFAWIWIIHEWPQFHLDANLSCARIWVVHEFEFEANSRLRNKIRGTNLSLTRHPAIAKQLRVQVRRLTLDDAQQLAAKVQFLYRVQVRRLAFDDAQQLHIWSMQDHGG